jgi:hypothetical protein
MAWNIRTSRSVGVDLEILVNAVNVDVAASVVLDASAVVADPVTGELKIVAGTPLAKSGNQYVPCPADGTGCLGILARTEVFPDNTSQSDLPSAMWHHGQWFRSDRIVNWTTNQANVRAALPTCKFT